MKHDDKRLLRQLKRDLKRAGNKRRRQHLKRELTENPEEAPYTDFDFGRTSSATLNGLDQDATRRRPPGKSGPSVGPIRDGIDHSDGSR
jgi:hypothetical protein